MARKDSFCQITGSHGDSIVEGHGYFVSNSKMMQSIAGLDSRIQEKAFFQNRKRDFLLIKITWFIVNIPNTNTRIFSKCLNNCLSISFVFQLSKQREISCAQAWFQCKQLLSLESFNHFLFWKKKFFFQNYSTCLIPASIT